MPGKSSTAVLRMRFSADLVSERPYVNMLLYLPYHALAHLGSIAAHGRKQSAKPLRDWMENRLSRLCIRERVLTTVITSGAAKCKALQRKLVEKMLRLQLLVCAAHSLDLLREIGKLAPFKWILRNVEAMMVFIKSHQNVLKAVLDVGEQAGEAVQPFLPSGTRCVSYVKMVKRFLESALMYASALGGREVQQWAKEKASNGTMYGNAANDSDDHAQLADSESEL
jgi:hypothetical protein